MKILVVFGTRPEAIKMAPVLKALAASETIRPILCVTGQHREMLAEILNFFELVPDHDLALMRPEQDLVYLTSAVLRGMRRVLAAEKPDWVLVHGDTTTAMAAALAAFYAGCRIGHVEAGLRTGDLRQPWPEEMNRSLVDRIADRLFAPTASARDNLLRENLSANKIVVTGNTVIDALFAVRDALRDAALTRSLAERFGFLDPAKRLVLVTGHRRESFGRGFDEICAGLRRLAERSDVEIVYPVHLNPAVQRPVRRALADLSNVHLIDPVGYVAFVYLMMRQPCDPDGFRRYPGGGARARQAGISDATGDGAARSGRRRNGGARRYRSAAYLRRGYRAVGFTRALRGVCPRAQSLWRRPRQPAHPGRASAGSERQLILGMKSECDVQCAAE